MILVCDLNYLTRIVPIPLNSMLMFMLEMASIINVVVRSGNRPFRVPIWFVFEMLICMVCFFIVMTLLGGA